MIQHYENEEMFSKNSEANGSDFLGNIGDYVIATTWTVMCYTPRQNNKANCYDNFHTVTTNI